jgi:hypothetical protein
MSISTKNKSLFLGRFDELIKVGEQLLANPVDVPAQFDRDSITGRSYVSSPASQTLDWSQLVEWRTKVATLLSQAVPKDSVHEGYAKMALAIKADSVQGIVSILRALRDDFEKGFFDDLFLRIEAEVASDYMGQATQLLKEGLRGSYDYVPAAVLCGAVLEKALRKLCELQNPSISPLKQNGEPKTLNPLIDDLKAVGVFNELKAKHLRSWTDVRNKAAHGEFDQFKRSDVEQMLDGVSNFLADHLG